MVAEELKVCYRYSAMTGGLCLLLLVCQLMVAEELNVCYRYSYDRRSLSSAADLSADNS